MQENETLKFKPINDGLGFHPFSDGLPYAPHTKGTPSKVTPTLPKPQAPFISLPKLENRQSTLRKIEPPAFQKKWIEEKILGDPTAFYAMKRITAFTVDTLLSLCLVSLGFAGITEMTGIGLDGSEPQMFFLIATSLFFGLNHILITLQDLLFGTSFGKHFVGLEFNASSGKVFLRAVLFPLSLLPVGLGILYMFFDSKKRMLHDVLSGAQPVEK
ncbi:MAG: RDD family protein [Xanthomonadaceae bacterium]|nr:RDD family protein [Xanthomonadaceae bacterium]